LRIVVVGTTGQLALALHRRARSAGLALAAPRRIDISQRSEVNALFQAQRPDIVVNASAYTNVDGAERDQERAYAVNASGPRWLAEWCELNGAALIHVSTDYVFDGEKEGEYVENDPTGPLGVYGASKLAGEQHVRASLERHVIVRTSWLFSADGQNFVKTLVRLASERDSLRVVADQRGRPTAANDLADALLGVARVMLRGDAHFGTFHFAGTGATTWFDFARAIMREQALYTGRRPEVVAIGSGDYPTLAKRPRNSVLSTYAFESKYGVHPRSWQDGLRETIAEACKG
jgi:dTDP-4-dehydrorhamnose reductase